MSSEPSAFSPTDLYSYYYEPSYEQMNPNIVHTSPGIDQSELGGCLEILEKDFGEASLGWERTETL